MTASAPDFETAFWSWQLRGSCQEFSAELFFPEEEPRRRIRREREEQAKRICRDCPVLATCREHALTTPERYGVWGAMTTQERLRVSTPAS